MEVAVDEHAGQSQGVGLMSGDAGAFPECEVNTLITPDHTTIQVRKHGLVESEFICLHGNASTQDSTKRRRFVVHTAGWQHCMVLHGRICMWTCALHICT